MSHEKLKWMKDSLICVVENELCNLGEVDTKELGEAIDMIKDLEEAIYYATVTEAMNKPGKEWEMKKSDHHQNIDNDRMYYDEPMWRDEYGGRSPMSRKMYMESKEMHKDKAIQLQELEKYAQELTADLMEMIQDATPEEKQHLSNRIATLATKIK